MYARQSLPEQWLIVDHRLCEDTLLRLRRGSGVLVLAKLSAGEWRRLRRLANLRSLTVATEGRAAARVHNLDELRRALLKRVPIILLSPIHPTASHAEWRPQPRMRAAASARLAKRRLFALGGMDERRFARVKDLGFQGWAGISAFRT